MDAIAETIPNLPPQSKRTLWQERLGAWQVSGLSQKAWCEREGVPLSSLRYWRKKLSGRSVPAVVPPSTSRLIPVSLTQLKTALTINSEGLSIEVAPDIDRALLRDVLRILRSA